MSRIGRIANRIRQASGATFWVNETERIEGQTCQAAAYAADNKVKVTTKLAKSMTDDELAWVISHEVAHLEKQHTERLRTGCQVSSIVARSGVRAVDSALKASGVGIGGRIIWAIAAATIGGTSVVLATLKQSRDHEVEADARAIDLTRSAGFDPEASVTAYMKIYGGQIPQTSFFRNITSTHPAPRERYRNLKCSL